MLNLLSDLFPNYTYKVLINLDITCRTKNWRALPLLFTDEHSAVKLADQLMARYELSPFKKYEDGFYAVADTLFYYIRVSSRVYELTEMLTKDDLPKIPRLVRDNLTTLLLDFDIDWSGE